MTEDLMQRMLHRHFRAAEHDNPYKGVNEVKRC